MARAITVGQHLHWRYIKSRRAYLAPGGIEVRAVEVPLGAGRVSLAWKLVLPGRRDRPIFGTYQEAMLEAEGIKITRVKRTRKTRRRTRRSR
jgi:hypothetical protein